MLSRTFSWTEISTMGNDVSRIRLEPAEEVEEAPYELQSIK